jgi:hypothetical protein
MRPDELERRLRERLDALGPAPRAELLHVLMLQPEIVRSRRNPKAPAASQGDDEPGGSARVGS